MKTGFFRQFCANNLITAGLIGGVVATLLSLTGCATPAEQDWERTRRSGSLYSYQRYVQRYPQSPHAAEARERIRALEERDKARQEEKAFRDAERKGSTRKLKDYLKEYPQGKYTAEARTLLEESEFRDAMKSRSTHGLRKFLKEYPNSQYAESAKLTLEVRNRIMIKPVAILKKESYIQNLGGMRMRVNNTHLRLKLTNRSKQTIAKPRYFCEGHSSSTSGGVYRFFTASKGGIYPASLAPGTSATTTFIANGDFQLNDVSCTYVP